MARMNAEGEVAAPTDGSSGSNSDTDNESTDSVTSTTPEDRPNENPQDDSPSAEGQDADNPADAPSATPPSSDGQSDPSPGGRAIPDEVFDPASVPDEAPDTGDSNNPDVERDIPSDDGQVAGREATQSPTRYPDESDTTPISKDEISSPEDAKSYVSQRVQNQFGWADRGEDYEVVQQDGQFVAQFTERGREVANLNAAEQQVEEQYPGLTYAEDYTVGLTDDGEAEITFTESGREKLTDQEQDLRAAAAAATTGSGELARSTDATDFETYSDEVQQIEQAVQRANPQMQAGEDFTVSITESGEFTAETTEQYREEQVSSQVNESFNAELERGRDYSIVEENGSLQPDFTKEGLNRIQSGTDSARGSSFVDGLSRSADEAVSAIQDGDTSTATDALLGRVDEATLEAIADARSGDYAGVGDAAAGSVDEWVSNARIDSDIANNLTTGGILSERPSSNEGLLPGSVAGVDLSEKGFRRAASDVDQFKQRFDENEPLKILGSDAPERISQGLAGAGVDLVNLPSHVTSAETATEVATSAPGAIRSEGIRDVGETAAGVSTLVGAGLAQRATSKPLEFAGGLAGSTVYGAGVGYASKSGFLSLRERVTTGDIDSDRVIDFNNLQREDVASGQSRLTRHSESAVGEDAKHAMADEDLPVDAANDPATELQRLSAEHSPEQVREVLDAADTESVLYHATGRKKGDTYEARSYRDYDPDAMYFAGSVSKNFLPEAGKPGLSRPTLRRPRPVAAVRSLFSDEQPTIVATAGEVDTMPSSATTRGDVSEFLRANANNNRFYVQDPDSGRQSGEAEALVAAQAERKSDPMAGAGIIEKGEGTEFVNLNDPLATEIRGETVRIQTMRQRGYEGGSEDTTVPNALDDANADSMTVEELASDLDSRGTPGGQPGIPVAPLPTTGGSAGGLESTSTGEDASDVSVTVDESSAETSLQATDVDFGDASSSTVDASESTLADQIASYATSVQREAAAESQPQSDTDETSGSDAFVTDSPVVDSASTATSPSGPSPTSDEDRSPPVVDSPDAGLGSPLAFGAPFTSASPGSPSSPTAGTPPGFSPGSPTPGPDSSGPSTPPRSRSQSDEDDNHPLAVFVGDGPESTPEERPQPSEPSWINKFQVALAGGGVEARSSPENIGELADDQLVPRPLPTEGQVSPGEGLAGGLEAVESLFFVGDGDADSQNGNSGWGGWL